MELNDAVLQHLRQVVDLPDFTGTRYQMESEIGRGGLGVVYAARDRELDRRVAIKVMDAELAGEAKLIARLEHPGIVPVHECGTLPDGRNFKSAQDLKVLLSQDKVRFAECVTDKLLTYALGRGLERYDRRTIKDIASKIAPGGYHFSDLVLGIVNSLPFQMSHDDSKEVSQKL